MIRFGYFNGDLTEDIFKSFKKEGASKLYLNNEYEINGDTLSCLNSIIDSLSEEDELIIYDFSNLKLTLAELTSLFRRLKEMNSSLKIINKNEVFNLMTDQELMEFISEISDANKSVMREKGKNITKKNQHVGRPKISDETIERINYLRFQKNYTLKDISVICDVSIGTAYKYLNQTK